MKWNGTKRKMKGKLNMNILTHRTQDCQQNRTWTKGTEWTQHTQHKTVMNIADWNEMEWNVFFSATGITERACFPFHKPVNSTHAQPKNRLTRTSTRLQTARNGTKWNGNEMKRNGMEQFGLVRLDFFCFFFSRSFDFRTGFCGLTALRMCVLTF